jgi:hypothetical protein
VVVVDLEVVSAELEVEVEVAFVEEDDGLWNSL